jgi:hypothetical protein
MITHPPPPPPKKSHTTNNHTVISRGRWLLSLPLSRNVAVSKVWWPRISSSRKSGRECFAVFRIHDILEWIWIRIRGSMPLTNGSGSWFGSWIRILLFSSLTLKMPTKNNFCLNIFSAYYFLKVHIHNFPKIKSQKESQIVGIKVFLAIFAWWQKDPDPDPYLWLMDPDPDPGGPKTCGFGYGFGSGTLVLWTAMKRS